MVTHRIVLDAVLHYNFSAITPFFFELFVSSNIELVYYIVVYGLI